MKCLICGKTDIKTVDTVISDFVMDRIGRDVASKKRQNCASVRIAPLHFTNIE